MCDKQGQVGGGIALARNLFANNHRTGKNAVKYKIFSRCPVTEFYASRSRRSTEEN